MVLAAYAHSIPTCAGSRRMLGRESEPARSRPGDPLRRTPCRHALLHDGRRPRSRPGRNGFRGARGATSRSALRSGGLHSASGFAAREHRPGRGDALSGRGGPRDSRIVRIHRGAVDGSWDGEFIVIEPMMTRESPAAKPSLREVVAQPASGRPLPDAVHRRLRRGDGRICRLAVGADDARSVAGTAKMPRRRGDARLAACCEWG